MQRERPVSGAPRTQPPTQPHSYGFMKGGNKANQAAGVPDSAPVTKAPVTKSQPMQQPRAPATDAPVAPAPEQPRHSQSGGAPPMNVPASAYGDAYASPDAVPQEAMSAKEMMQRNAEGGRASRGGRDAFGGDSFGPDPFGGDGPRGGGGGRT